VDGGVRRLGRGVGDRGDHCGRAGPSLTAISGPVRPHGEDGTIQGYFDTLEVPYAGGGVLDSALCMDKHFMKIALEAAGIPVAPWVTVRRKDWDRDASDVSTRAAGLGLPVFVKPARAGSSVGVSKVENADELDAGWPWRSPRTTRC